MMAGPNTFARLGGRLDRAPQHRLALGSPAPTVLAAVAESIIIVIHAPFETSRVCAGATERRLGARKRDVEGDGARCRSWGTRWRFHLLPRRDTRSASGRRDRDARRRTWWLAVRTPSIFTTSRCPETVVVHRRARGGTAGEDLVVSAILRTAAAASCIRQTPFLGGRVIVSATTGHRGRLDAARCQGRALEAARWHPVVVLSAPASRRSGAPSADRDLVAASDGRQCDRNWARVSRPDFRLYAATMYRA